MIVACTHTFLHVYMHVRIRAILHVYVKLVICNCVCLYTHILARLHELTGQNMEEIEPRSIVENSALLERAIDHYTQTKNMPDVSDKPTITDNEMRLWQKQKRKSRLKPHTTLGGVCGTWLNTSYDFAISKNMWPVVFKDPHGDTIDLVPETTVAVWIKYVSFMVCLRALLHVCMRLCIRAVLHVYTSNL